VVGAVALIKPAQELVDLEVERQMEAPDLQQEEREIHRLFRHLKVTAVEMVCHITAVLAVAAARTHLAGRQLLE
jgi:hypothetical protein